LTLRRFSLPSLAALYTTLLKSIFTYSAAHAHVAASPSCELPPSCRRRRRSARSSSRRTASRVKLAAYPVDFDLPSSFHPGGNGIAKRRFPPFPPTAGGDAKKSRRCNACPTDSVVG
ncbi:hypothetical protein X777_13407, partial [Ooceraea biroi]